MSTSASFLLTAFVPPVPEDPPGLVYQPDHAGEAEARLLAQFDDAVKLHALVRVLVGPVQELEQAAFGVRDAFNVETVTGDQLEVLGEIVGEPRQGRLDAHYRAYVQARILANSADGAPGTLYKIARTLLGAGVLSLRIVQAPPAHYDFEVAASALALPWDGAVTVAPEVVAFALADALFMATSAGVGLTLLYQYGVDADQLLWASGDVEEDSVTQGLADTSDTGPGGMSIGAEERF
jgi:hypothetical protein